MTQVFGIAILPNGSACASANIDIERDIKSVVSQDGSVVIPERTRVTTGSDGSVDFELLPGNYLAVVRTTTGAVSFSFVVPSGATSVQWADCIDSAAIAQFPGAVELVLAAKDEAVAAKEEAIAAAGGGTDVRALVTSTSLGIAATTNGQQFAVATGTQTDLYRNAGGIAILMRSDIEEFGDVIPALPPTGAALVASAQGRKTTAVQLRKILGRAYAYPADGAAIINAVTVALAAAGLTIIDLDGIRVNLTSSLFLRSYMKALLSPTTTFVRGFATGFATFRVEGNYDATNRAVGVVWTGGRIVCEDDNLGGHNFVAIIDDCTFTDLQILGSRRRSVTDGGHAFRFGGDRNTFINCVAWSDKTDTGLAGIRILFGDGNRVIGARVKSGDDGLQFCPNLDDPGSPFFHLPTINSIFENCYVESASKAIIAAMISSDAGAVAGSNGIIKGCSFKGIRGTYGTSAIVIGNNLGNSATPDQVDGITLEDIVLSKGPVSSIGVSNNAVSISGAWNRAVRNVTMNNVIVDGSTYEGSDIGLWVGCIGAKITGDGNKFIGRYRGMRVSFGASVIDLGADFVAATEGVETDAAGRHVIATETPASGTIIRLHAGCTIEGVSSPTIASVVTSMAGIYLAAGTTLIADDLTINARAGSTGTKAIQTVAGAVASYDRLTTTCAVTLSGVGEVRRNSAAIAINGAASVAGGVLTLPEATAITVDTDGAASNDIVTITPFSGMRPNTVVSLHTANNARDIVLKHGTGNIRLSQGADVSLLTTTSLVSLLWDGTNFNQVGAVISSSGASILPSSVLVIDGNTASGSGVSTLAKHVFVSGTLSASRTWTLNRTGAIANDTIIFYRDAGGAFPWTLNRASADGSANLAILNQGEWAAVVYDGAQWQAMERGRVFTSTAPGWVPASGGGTTNFLRADGTWSAPPAGGGGGSLTDGDHGDIVVSGSGSILSLDYAAINPVIAPTFANVSGKPTTLSGYGITDAAAASHTHAFADITGKPTTVSGFGITDAVDTTSVQTIGGTKTFSSAVTISGVGSNISNGTTTGTANYSGGATTSGNTKTVNLGTAGLSGSTTNINVGSAVSGSAGTLTINSPAVVFGAQNTSFTISDASFTLADNGDAAKKAQFDLAAITTGTTRTFALPDASGTLALNSLFGASAAGLAPASGGGTANFLRADGTWAAPAGGGGSTWGGITGTLSAQTDLQAALDAKVALTGAQTIGGIKTLTSEIGIASMTSDPASPSAGQMWYRSDLDELKLRGVSQTFNVSRQRDLAFLIPDSGQVVATCIGTAGISGVSAGADRMDLYQWVPPRTFTAASAQIRVSTLAASAMVKVVVYDSDSNGRPNTKLIETADMDASSTGNKSATISHTFLQGRTYWIGVRHSAAPSIVAWPLAGVPFINGDVPSVSAKSILRRNLAYATAAPSTWGWDIADISNGSPAAIWFGVA